MKEKDQVPYGYIYRITNRLNGKTYIGKHKFFSKELWRQYLGSGILILQARAKHGDENFTKSFISWCWNKDELAEKELEEILKEVNSGKAEYNINRTNFTAPKIYKNTQILYDNNAVELYLSGEYTKRELSYKFNVDYGTVSDYLKEFSEDPRFKNIRQGKGLKKKSNSKDAQERARITYNSNRVEKVCPHCNKSFLYIKNNFERHMEACKNYPNCETCGVKLTKKTSRHCKKHIQKAKIENKGHYFRGNTSEKGRKAAFYSTHKRHHLNKNTVKDDCFLCNPSLPNPFNSPSLSL